MHESAYGGNIANGATSLIPIASVFAKARYKVLQPFMHGLLNKEAPTDRVYPDRMDNHQILVRVYQSQCWISSFFHL